MPVPGGVSSSLVRRVYGQLSRLANEAGKSAQPSLITEFRGEIFRLCRNHYQKGSGTLFSKSVNLYYYLYRGIPRDKVDESHVEVLLSSVQDLRTTLLSDVQRVESPSSLEPYQGFLQAWNDCVRDLLKESLEKRDVAVFKMAWDLIENISMLPRDEEAISQLNFHIQDADLEEKRKIERKIQFHESRRDMIKEFRNEGKFNRFGVAAKAYRAYKAGEIDEETFGPILRDPILNEYHSFRELTETYLELRDESFGAFLPWELGDRHPFSGVQAVSRPVETWMKEFYCFLSVITLPLDQLEGRELTESVNPLAEAESRASSFPEFDDALSELEEADFEGLGLPADVLESFTDRKALFTSLVDHAKEVLKERETDSLIEADLDPTKVSQYKRDYNDEFKKRFTLRQVAQSLGWLDSRPQDDPPVDGFGYPGLFYPKDGFVEQPDITFIHNLDQQAVNHIEGILNEVILESDDLVEEVEVDPSANLLSTLEEHMEDLAENNLTPRALFLDRIELWDDLLESPKFSLEQSGHDRIGHYQFGDEEIDTYGRTLGGNPAFILLEGDRPPTWIEYGPAEAPVKVEIEKVTRDLLDDLHSEGIDDLEEEEIRSRLQQVYMRIVYFFELDSETPIGVTLTKGEEE